MMLRQDQLEDEDISALTVHDSLYAYLAYCGRLDETPIDTLVRLSYVELPLQAL